MPVPSERFETVPPEGFDIHGLEDGERPLAPVSVLTVQ
jgi:hypothetical protein